MRHLRPLESSRAPMNSENDNRDVRQNQNINSQESTQRPQMS